MDLNNTSNIYKDMNQRELMKKSSDLSKKIEFETQSIMSYIKLEVENNVEDLKSLLDIMVQRVEDQKEIQYEIMKRNFTHVIVYHDQEMTISQLLKIKEAIHNKSLLIKEILVELQNSKKKELVKLHLELQGKLLEYNEELNEIYDILTDFNLHN